MQNNDSSHWFHIIPELAKLDRNELKNRFKDRQLVRKVEESISEIDEMMDYPKGIDENDFPDLVYRLYEIKNYWGRVLTKVIAEAAKSPDNKTATEILNRFIMDCPSPYFRKHAQNQLQQYE